MFLHAVFGGRGPVIRIIDIGDGGLRRATLAVHARVEAVKR
jgi:hypothetical protein